MAKQDDGQNLLRAEAAEAERDGCRKALEAVTVASRLAGLTYDQLVVACRNIGYNLTCGRCAEVFYTGISLAEHDAGCTSLDIAKMFHARSGRRIE